MIWLFLGLAVIGASSATWGYLRDPIPPDVSMPVVVGGALLILDFVLAAICGVVWSV